MSKAAARIADPVAHVLPPFLSPGPGSSDVIIGNRPAWRGVLASVAASLTQAKQKSDDQITQAEAATAAAAGTPGAAAAKTKEEATKALCATTMAATIAASAGEADKHDCKKVLPTPPHGPGVVTDGSKTVIINNLAACREGDSVLEPVGPPNQILVGEQTVIIGD